MLYFEIEWDEDQVRRTNGGEGMLFILELDVDQIRSFVKAVIDQYEKGLHDHGNQRMAIELAQESTVRHLEDNAEAVEELIEHTGTMH